MALKATIYKAVLNLSDMDRQVYAEHPLTLALHPSETEERLAVRLLAFALNVPADDQRGGLQFARGLSDSDEPDLWHKDLSGRLLHWIEVGQPDDRRLVKACARADRVSIYAYAGSTAVWWQGIAGKLGRLRNLAVWQVPADASRALGRLTQRAMQWQVTVQDGHVWVHGDSGEVELRLAALWGEAA